MITSEKKLTRRSFLATTALVAGAAASAGMAGCKSVGPEQVPELSETGESAAAAVEERSFIGSCRGNCGGNCALVAKVREGKIVSTFPLEIEGRPEGFENGCVRGQTNIARIYGAHRLRYPMKRVGEKGSGEWERISWDEALQTIADKMTAAINEYGPASICVQHGAGNMHNLLDSQSISVANCYGFNPSKNGIVSVGRD